MSLDLPQVNPGAVTLSVRGPGGFRELKRDRTETREANRGFQERREATFVGPPGLDCRLLIDDEEIQLASAENIVGEGRGARDAGDGGPMWSWTPGFYAGAVRAELIDGADLSLGTWWLDVSPDPEKTGSEIFEQMVEEISEFDQALLVGDEPARRPLGAVGENDDPHVLFERLRRRESDLDRAVAGVQREPASVLRPRRQFRPHRAVRRVDLRTLRTAARQPETCALLGPASGAPLAVGGGASAEPRFDVPAVERRLDAPINRCALYLLRSLRRRCRHLGRKLEEAVAKEPESETRTVLRGRLEHRLRILARIERKTRLAERRSPFQEVHRPELTSAGLTAVAAHPLYSRLWRVGWEALRRGASACDPADPLPLSPTWEVYERWCFVEIAGLLARWLPELEWSRSREGRRWAWRGRDGADSEVVFHYQKTAGRSNGRERCSLWSVSKELRPDLVLRWKRGQRRGFVVLDPKYRTGRDSVLSGMAESAHLYRDALRWGSARPDLSLLLVPRVRGELRWLAEEGYVRRHGVGAVALRPDTGPPAWFRRLVLGEAGGER